MLRVHMDESRRLKSTVALTGATGFIGHELQGQLLAAGYQVHALVRPASRRRSQLLAGVHAVDVALNDEPALATALHNVATVVYCAGTVRGAAPADFADANIDGLHRLCLAASAQSAPPHILLISSLAASRPQLSDYARSKFDGEQILRSMASLSWTILRPPAVYGPGDREMLPLFRAIRAGLALIVGPPAQRLSLLHVQDLGRAVIACLDQQRTCEAMVFELDDGRARGYSWQDIIGAARGAMPVCELQVPRAFLQAASRLNLRLSALLGYAPMLTPGKVRELSEPSWLCDNSRLHAATGWVPELPLHVGLARMFGKTVGP